MKKKTLVYIAPHLSTGGLPQYLFKQIESMVNDFDVYCIEWENVTGGVLVIQRNRIANILGTRLITLGEDKQELFSVLAELTPDIVHLQEIPEMFMPTEIADRLYSDDRTYRIVETSHDSSYDVNRKIYLPDKFLFVSQYQVEMYKSLNVPSSVVEYPIENKKREFTRDEALSKLGLDPNKKHVIVVGLFTPRKNQAETIEYARKLQGQPVQFHFLGNQADNFKFYWEPLMKDFPSNCTWWNERDDLDTFYQAADLFLFTSRGTATDKETMPLVIREALSWKVPSLIYNLPVYMGYFDKYDTIKYLQENQEDNLGLIRMQLGLQSTMRECIVVTAYPNSSRLVEMTKNTILHLKRYNLPIILASNYTLTDELTSLADYYVIGSSNILDKGTDISTFWAEYPEVSIKMQLTPDNIPPYAGPASQTNMHDGIAAANSLGFDVVYQVTYDTKTNDAWFETMRNEIQTKNIVVHKTNYASEGISDVIRGETFAIRTDFFLRTFPVITSLEDYYNWMRRLNSDINALEKLWYLQLEQSKDGVRYVEDEELYTIIHKDDERGKYRRGMIFEVLPIEGNTSEVLLLLSYVNTLEPQYEQFRIVVDGKVIATPDSNLWYQRHRIKYGETIKCELYDVQRNKVLSYRERVINESYFQQPNIINAQLRLKDKPMNNDTYNFNARWELPTQTMYYSCDRAIDFPVLISVKEYKSNAVLWAFTSDNIAANCEYWVLPIPKNVQSYEDDPHFTGVKLCIYNKETGEQLYEQPFFHKFVNIPTVTLSDFVPYRINYQEFFVDGKFAKATDKKYGLVVDVGANVGVFSEYMLRNNFAHKIVAVECDTNALKDLERNFKRESRVAIIPKALHYKEEPITFYQVSQNPTVSTTLTPEQVKNSKAGVPYDSMITVETISIGKLVEQYGVIDLLKIDIEGAEYDILFNAKDGWFRNINHLMVECHFHDETYEQKFHQLRDRLVSLGYHVDGINPNFNGMQDVYEVLYAQRRTV